MTRMLFMLGFVAVTSAEGRPITGALNEQSLQQPTVLRPASAEVDVLIREALEDRLAARNLPDMGFLGTSTRVSIREEMPSAGLRIGVKAVPQTLGSEFRLTSLSALQSEADRISTAVYFIAVDSPVITGELATVWLGVSMVLPDKPGVVMLCCCAAEGQFRRVDGRWTFGRWMRRTCS